MFRLYARFKAGFIRFLFCSKKFSLQNLIQSQLKRKYVSFYHWGFKFRWLLNHKYRIKLKQFLALILNEKLYMVALLVCFADEIYLLKK